MADVRRIGWSRQDHPAADLVDEEWLVANGLGGYASGTLGGVATRRYHGLLVAALPNPWGRTMMLDRLGERVTLADGSVVHLGVETLASDGQAPPAAGALEDFVLELGLPVWRYRVGQAVVEKRLLLAYRQNTVYLRYRMTSAGPNQEPLLLRLDPAMHFRPHDAPVSRPIDPYTLCVTGDRFEVMTSGPLPSLKMRVEGEHTTFHSYPARHEKIDYRWEAERGYEASGSLWSPGHFEATLTPRAPVYLVASAETWETMNAVEPSRAWVYEKDRRTRLLHAAPSVVTQDTALAELVLAADQFVIIPAGRTDDTTRARARGEALRSIIAGYHWFTDWGRDTMISLEGLTLCTGRYREARYILHTFAHYVRNGLLPNLFPEGSRDGQYNTADATLWFFHAVDRYLAYTQDRETLRVLLPTFEDIARAHVAGTSFGIHVDAADGLLVQGQDGVALTWMDALCEGWVVTPRRGKAVEINALWFNAMTLLAEWLRGEGSDGADTYQGLADRTQASFNRVFWSDPRGYLADVVGTDGNIDESLRPNQILAIALPHPVLDRKHWQAVVDLVANRLLTPYGLRSLDPNHPDFKRNYHGDLRTRDSAYHQGTVWSWLLGPFIDAWLKVYPARRDEAAALLGGLLDHLGKACIGQVSEIFDATAPFLPRGCIAQAWGVAELLRAWSLTHAANKGPGDAIE